jgi:RNA polymerase sigma factor (TIGR02999 family)
MRTMSPAGGHEPGTHVTTLLGRVAGGDRDAVDELFPVVYEQLRAMAGSFMRQQAVAHTLQPTSLVHEAYIKLLGPGGEALAAGSRDRAHFLALAARAMRQILVDHARAKAADKRGGGGDGEGWRRITLSDQEAGGTGATRVIDLLALEDALGELSGLDGRKAKLVELRFFGGLSGEEAAEVLGVSRATVANDWTFTRAWLARRLKNGDEG